MCITGGRGHGGIVHKSRPALACSCEWAQPHRFAIQKELRFMHTSTSASTSTSDSACDHNIICIHTYCNYYIYVFVARQKKTYTQLMIHMWAASPIYDKKMESTPGRSRSYECFVGVPIRILLPAVEPKNPSSYQPRLYDNRAARRFVLFRSRPPNSRSTHSIRRPERAPGYGMEFHYVVETMGCKCIAAF